MSGVTHGRSGTKEYNSWSHIIQRCLNPRNKRYKYYGGRGIRVCDSWRDSFAAFLSDVGLAPSAKHSIDRIDNNGHYEPDNVRWATDAEQTENRDDNKFITFKGQTRTISAWARELGLVKTTLWRRLEAGWSPEEAFMRAPNPSKQRFSRPASPARRKRGRR